MNDSHASPPAQHPTLGVLQPHRKSHILSSHAFIKYINIPPWLPAASWTMAGLEVTCYYMTAAQLGVAYQVPW